MTTDQINYLNIGLMIASAVAAMFLPFEMFVLSYAILGPLHYLTEISWLHKRQYFLPYRQDHLLLALLTFLVIFPPLFPAVYNFIGTGSMMHRAIYSSTMSAFYFRMSSICRIMLFVSFATAFTMILITNITKRVIAIIGIIITGVIIHKINSINVLFVVFLPTLIHVFIFTGAFLLLGALKDRSLSGIVALSVFLLCSIMLLLIHPAIALRPGSFVQSVYDIKFFRLNKHIFNIFFHRNATRQDVYYSDTGMVITRFIAYAYTYHYLNWFSKTSVIKWHQISPRSFIIIVLLWLASIGLYIADYRMGLAFLYMLSMLHVIDEFPLNFHSFRDIWKYLRQPVKSR